jgi:hypothetical protein
MGLVKVKGQKYVFVAYFSVVYISVSEPGVRKLCLKGNELSRIYILCCFAARFELFITFFTSTLE